MDRLEYIRSKVDQIIENGNTNEKKYAYLHLYGVSNCATLLAFKRGLEPEISALIAILHDIAFYETSIRKNHAINSAKRAKEILEKSELFTENEIYTICKAIEFHSEKAKKHGPYEELIKDSEVLAQYLYNPKIPVSDNEKVRLFYLLEELNIKQKVSV